MNTLYPSHSCCDNATTDNASYNHDSVFQDEKKKIPIENNDPPSAVDNSNCELEKQASMKTQQDKASTEESQLPKFSSQSYGCYQPNKHLFAQEQAGEKQKQTVNSVSVPELPSWWLQTHNSDPELYSQIIVSQNDSLRLSDSSQSILKKQNPAPTTEMSEIDQRHQARTGAPINTGVREENWSPIVNDVPDQKQFGAIYHGAVDRHSHATNDSSIYCITQMTDESSSSPHHRSNSSSSRGVRNSNSTECVRRGSAVAGDPNSAADRNSIVCRNARKNHDEYPYNELDKTLLESVIVQRPSMSVAASSFSHDCCQHKSADEGEARCTRAHKPSDFFHMNMEQAEVSSFSFDTGQRHDSMLKPDEKLDAVHHNPRRELAVLLQKTQSIIEATRARIAEKHQQTKMIIFNTNQHCAESRKADSGVENHREQLRLTAAQVSRSVEATGNILQLFTSLHALIQFAHEEFHVPIGETVSASKSGSPCDHSATRLPQHASGKPNFFERAHAKIGELERRLFHVRFLTTALVSKQKKTNIVHKHQDDEVCIEKKSLQRSNAESESTYCEHETDNASSAINEKAELAAMNCDSGNDQTSQADKLDERCRGLERAENDNTMTVRITNNNARASSDHIIAQNYDVPLTFRLREAAVCGAIQRASLRRIYEQERSMMGGSSIAGDYFNSSSEQSKPNSVTDCDSNAGDAKLKEIVAEHTAQLELALTKPLLRSDCLPIEMLLAEEKPPTHMSKRDEGSDASFDEFSFSDTSDRLLNLLDNHLSVKIEPGKDQGPSNEGLSVLNEPQGPLRPDQIKAACERESRHWESECRLAAEALRHLQYQDELLSEQLQQSRRRNNSNSWLEAVVTRREFLDQVCVTLRTAPHPLLSMSANAKRVWLANHSNEW